MTRVAAVRFLTRYTAAGTPCLFFFVFFFFPLGCTFLFLLIKLIFIRVELIHSAESVSPVQHSDPDIRIYILFLTLSCIMGSPKGLDIVPYAIG